MIMGQRTNILLQIEGHSGARLNRVYHLQWGYRKYMPMAFLHLLSGRYFKPEKADFFEFFTKSLDLDGVTMLERDWSKFDFNKLEDCQEVLGNRDNNNGAMIVVYDDIFAHAFDALTILSGTQHIVQMKDEQ